MNPPLITVVVVNWKSMNLIPKLYNNIREKSSDQTEIAFLVMDNMIDDTECRSWAADLPGVTVCPVDPCHRTGSHAHAFALDSAMQMIQSPYTLVIDPDIHVFKRDWDTFCLERMEHHKAWIAGVPYPFWKLGKYHDFPACHFSLFKTRLYHDLNTTWAPLAETPAKRIYNFSGRQVTRLFPLATRSRLAARPRLLRIGQKLENIFGVTAPDTGFCFARAASQKHIKSLVFDAVLACDHLQQKYQKIPALRDLATDFELYTAWDQPFLTHQYRSQAWIWKTPRGNDTDFWNACVRDAESALEAVQP